MTNCARAANFDPIARPYRWIEYLTFGRSLERCRNRFIPKLRQSRSVLVLGDGDGRFLSRLLAANPDLHAQAVDTSPAMLRLLERRAGLSIDNAPVRLRVHHGDALTFYSDRSFDLIVTHFFLDCLTQPEVDALALRIARSVSPNALWLVSEFRIPEGPLHWPARGIVRLLYLAFRLLTGLRVTELPDHAAALTAAGFTRIAQHLSLGGLLTGELWIGQNDPPAANR
jgi:ubiquinone/menaquinone biosynthesis C-methylase UbiE